MKRTTSKYSIRQVSFTNLCFVVVPKGAPHLTLKPSIFQLVSVVVFHFCLCFAVVGLVCVLFVSFWTTLIKKNQKRKNNENMKN